MKQCHFEAAAQYRLSRDDNEKAKYGEEIGRLRVAETLAKKGLDAGRKGVSDNVMSDLKQLQGVVKSTLESADRDNLMIYCQAVPTPAQLPPINGVGMVKLQTPTEVAEPIAWLMSGGSGSAPLFSGLVPYGVHLALSECFQGQTVVADLRYLRRPKGHAHPRHGRQARGARWYRCEVGVTP